MNRNIRLGILITAIGFSIAVINNCSHKPSTHTPTTADTLRDVRAQLDSVIGRVDALNTCLLKSANYPCNIAGCWEAEMMLNEWADRDSMNQKGGAK